MPPVTSGGALLSRRLRELIDRMQMASRGDDALDRMLDDALEELYAARYTQIAGLPVQVARGGAWTSNLNQALTLLPEDYNISVGRRDSVCWAWAQPNDCWEPSVNEARHDHPAGSGLVVAHTAALALTCAALILVARRVESGL